MPQTIAIGLKAQKMNDYSISLALAYFKEKREHYVIGELAEILGYNGEQITELIQYLLSKQYISYIDDLLAITPKGITLLISKNQDTLFIQEDDFITPHIDPNHALPIDAPYVPVGFTKKFKK